MLVQVAKTEIDGDDGCRGGTGRVGGDKEGDAGSRRDTSGVGNNGCDTIGHGKGKEDEVYVLRIDGETEQVGRSKGDAVSEGISGADKNDELQNGVGSGYTGQFLNNDVLESIIKITLKTFPFMRTSLRGVNTVVTKTRNDPQRPTTTHNDPQRSTTTHNDPTTIHNDPQRSHNDPQQPGTTTHDDPQRCVT